MVSVNSLQLATFSHLRQPPFTNFVTAATGDDVSIAFAADVYCETEVENAGA
jgi:hypothetical protein